MQPISFSKINEFLISKLGGYSLTDFYLRRHPYFEFTKENIPQITIKLDKILALLQLEFKILDFLYEEHNLKELYLFFKDKHYHSEIEFIDDWKNNLKYVSINEIITLCLLANSNAIKSYPAKINLLNQNISRIEQAILKEQQRDKNDVLLAKLEEIIQKQEIEQQKKLNELQEEIKQLENLGDLKQKESYKIQIRELQSQIASFPIKTNESTQKERILSENKKNEDKISELNKGLNAQRLEKEEYFTQNIIFDVEKEQKELNIFFEITNNFDHQKSYRSLFHKIYNSYDWCLDDSWKDVLTEILKKDIPKCYDFHVPVENRYNSHHETGFTKPEFGAFSEDEKTNDNLFPIWYALGNTLANKKLLKNAENTYYLSFDNGSYAKILPIKNQKIEEELSIVSHHKSEIFIIYKEYSFKIMFGSSDLLFHSSDYDKINKRREEEEEQRQKQRDDDDYQQQKRYQQQQDDDD